MLSHSFGVFGLSSKPNLPMSNFIKPVLVIFSRLKLQELQEANRKAQELRQQKANGYKKMDDILYYQSLPFIFKAIQKELISYHHNNLLTNYFDIEKIANCLAQKYYWSIFCYNVDAYVKGCDVCLASKAVHHKAYGNF